MITGRNSSRSFILSDLSKDDDIPKNMQNDFLHQMYKEFGTIEEEYFYDRLEDGKYDEGFKERQVKEKRADEEKWNWRLISNGKRI